MATTGNFTLLVQKHPFFDLLKDGYISLTDIQRTEDGFFVCTKSLANILSSAGISYLCNASGGSQMPVQGYYDDWHLFAVNFGTTCTYGLLKMREQENDAYDNNDPGVTVSFVTFQLADLKNCLSSSTNTNRNTLMEEINRVVQTPGESYDDTMQDYFENPAKDASYLIAELYIKHIIASSAVNGVIDAPAIYDDVLNGDDDRIPDFMEANDSEAGVNIFYNNQIHISSMTNPTIYEKYAILALHTANVTFNSFAAEVKFHAAALEMWPQYLIPAWYNAALRADMALGEEEESGGFDEYYDLESDLVQEQIPYHGEY